MSSNNRRHIRSLAAVLAVTGLSIVLTTGEAHAGKPVTAVTYPSKLR